MATRGQVSLRFEDVAQDGRVLLEPLGASLGLVWRDAISQHPLYPWCRDQGILPITTRFVFEGGPGPVAVEDPIDVAGDFVVTRTVDAAGATHRFLLTITTQLHAPIGRTNLPPPDEAGTRAFVGSVVAEHVFTRPFAEAHERRVTELGDFGRTAEVVAWAEPKALLELPEGATPIDPMSTDPTPIVFGATHTDSNQHVNSLVYPRLFEEAALRRLAARGRSTDVLARRLDVRYRKPSFVGDRLALTLQLYEHGGHIGAAGAFFEPGGDPASGRVFLQLTLH